ncbi:MAG TPA: 1-deoxy-D-xylulose-5-phosphate reductoisomerase [Gammaproteobacteria bacterium]|nr:1-deoxy-D-xylulose-5-phosphate reductoisomerase [Gammaproteobacteria bacterium]
MKGLAILGATGSVGVSTLDVVARNPERFAVRALTGCHNWTRLLEQCRRFRPDVAVMVDPEAARRLAEAVAAEGLAVEVQSGAGALADAAARDDVDFVMAAIVGAAGLLPTLAAARAGKRVLLANKEAVVMAGGLLLAALAESGGTLVPIDSEHNALFQCLPAGGSADPCGAGVVGLMLTASGGPFLDTPLADLAAVTPDAACRHPNWDMGRKISVDSATMMNKGLEIIEACRLFGVGPGQVRVVVHPESIVHSLVEYRDGSVLAQLSNPDMRTPIAHALAWPERIVSGVTPLDLAALGNLSFRPAEKGRFPCLALAIAAAECGGAAPIALNAANEVAVAAFLEARIRFTAIPVVIDAVLAQYAGPDPGDLEAILALDARARGSAEEKIRELAL